jgi:nicotinamide-nucleotide amidase
MKAEVIAIGDEIVSGQCLDTNSQWLSQRLEELGVRVLYHTAVGDELAPGVEVFRQAIARADIVVSTGGLGPTADDLTREALAEAAGRPLQLDGKALALIREMFARRNRPMPVSNERQAMFPAGSRVVWNPHGTAPGIDLELERDAEAAAKGTVPFAAVQRPGQFPACRIICLPGVPAEMVEMWDDSVAAAIAEFAGSGRRVIRRRLIHCFGAGESQIEAMLPDLIRRGRRPTVGITASKATITLRITADGDSEDECQAAIVPVEAIIRQCLGTLVFGEEDEELQDVVVGQLRAAGKTLATAECGTGGLLSAWLSAADPSGEVFRGGLVFAHPAETAESLAADCRKRFAAHYGLAATIPPRLGREPAAEDSLAAGHRPTLQIALADPHEIQSRPVPLVTYHGLSCIMRAKQTLDFLRLRLMASLSES